MTCSEVLSQPAPTALVSDVGVPVPTVRTGLLFARMGTVIEEDVFQAVANLVATGEYRDRRIRKLGPERAPLRRLADGRPDSADLRRWQRERPKTLNFQRGTEEYREALRAGLLEPLPPLVPATQDAVTEAEEVIGWPLPSLLRRLYLEIGNGGFGPHNGILGVRGGASNANDNFRDIIETHRAFSSHPDDPLSAPPWLVWIFDWGCTIWSMVDCRDASGPMWFNEEGEMQPEGITVAEWFDCWVAGRLCIPCGPGAGRDH